VRRWGPLDAVRIEIDVRSDPGSVVAVVLLTADSGVAPGGCRVMEIPRRRAMKARIPVGSGGRQRWTVLLPLLLTVAGCDAGDAVDGVGGAVAGDAATRQPVGAPAESALSPTADPTLEAAIREATAGFDGEIGVAVRHLQRDVRVAVDGDRRFFLASVYKLPIAYAALMDRGSGEPRGLSPYDSLRVGTEDRAPGETPFVPGASPPVRRLVERALARSDNTASDVLLRAIGGPETVLRSLQRLGIEDIRVDRTLRRIFAEWQGAPAPGDERDTGTAEAIVALLAALHEGAGLSPEARSVILEGMVAADTGPDRIRAGVPAGTAVAHKTGTLGPFAHDVALVPLPGGRGDVALAVLIRSNAPLAERERVIAAVAQTVWERFAAAEPGGPGR
jgi:beta-lactamase class A